MIKSFKTIISIACAAVMCLTSAFTANANESTADLTIILDGLDDPYGITVTLTADSVTYSAAADESGTVFFDDILRTDADGNFITYRITKDIPYGYSAVEWVDITLYVHPLTLTLPYTKDDTTGSGDINNDGTISMIDAVILQKHIHSLENDRLYNADCNGDGKINIFDLVLLKAELRD